MIRKYFGNAFHPVSEINFDFLPGKFFTLAEQVHKNRVKIVTGEDLNAKVKMIDGYDGLVTALFDVNLIIRTADCVPVLLQDKQNKIIAAIHSGREGTQGKIVVNAIDKMKKIGAEVENISAEMGPAICGWHYNVSPNKFEKFVETTGVEQQKYFLDIKKVIRFQLLKAGVNSHRISNNNICTFDNRLYFSYRYNKTNKRQYSYIMQTD